VSATAPVDSSFTKRLKLNPDPPATTDSIIRSIKTREFLKCDQHQVDQKILDFDRLDDSIIGSIKTQEFL
jgi:hypothetical protein